MKRRKIHYAWWILLGVILVRGFAGGGINMTSGLFLAPVSKDIGVGIGTLSIYLSITSVVMVLWLPMAGKLINKYDIRLMAAAGASLQALSFMAMGWMHHVTGWYLLAVPHAMGATILVSLLGPILINRWFSRNAGLMMGIQMAFVGIFGAVLQPVTSGIIAESGWRIAYVLVGGGTFLVVIAAAFILLRNRPQDKRLTGYSGKGYSADGEAEPLQGDFPDISEKDALQSPAFYLLLLFMIAITGAGIFTQHIPTYGALLGYPIQDVGMALAYASVGSAVGSVAIGIISDRIGCLKTCYGMIGLGIAAMLGFLISGESFWVFGISTFLHGLVSSGVMVLAPILTLKFFGQKDYEKIYAKISMGAPIAAIVLIPVYGFIYDIMQNYLLVLAGIIGLLLIAMVCIAVGWKKRCTSSGCPGWRER